MAFTLGQRILLSTGLHGIISEVVPAGAIPRTISHRQAWRRADESYVVTVLAPRVIVCCGRRSTELIPKRIWPNPESIALRSKIYA